MRRGYTAPVILDLAVRRLVCREREYSRQLNATLHQQTVDLQPFSRDQFGKALKNGGLTDRERGVEELQREWSAVEEKRRGVRGRRKKS